MAKTVVVSGGFDPLHIGHVEMMKEAKALGDKLIVIINNDNWIKKKKGVPFMEDKERKAIIEAIRYVDEVVISSHPENPQGAKEMSVSAELEKIKPDIFANGGDRDEKNAKDPNSSLYYDIETCKKLGIEMVFNVGKHGKIQSSSWLIKKAAENAK
ncbi:MAG: adenylyltransferase/cytidyltransferase family protein [Candidatus Doudnabacteria bacterium]|nr:adenylyltransferase/cytidyltransferase family protein [Candidatus Doudnabacteria bacterium]